MVWLFSLTGIKPYEYGCWRHYLGIMASFVTMRHKYSRSECAGHIQLDKGKGKGIGKVGHDVNDDVFDSPMGWSKEVV